jgi:Tat protein translocase TatB subunit
MRLPVVGVCYTTGSAVMFNIGFGELAIICIVLIVAVGPEKLPSMMKTLGKTMRTLRQASRDLRQSTGIDELLNDTYDHHPPPRRPYTPPKPAEPTVSRSEEPLAADSSSEPSAVAGDVAAPGATAEALATPAGNMTPAADATLASAAAAPAAVAPAAQVPAAAVPAATAPAAPAPAAQVPAAVPPDTDPFANSKPHGT